MGEHGLHYKLSRGPQVSSLHGPVHGRLADRRMLRRAHMQLRCNGIQRWKHTTGPIRRMSKRAPSFTRLADAH
jgi:hypothetical protein